MFHENSEVFITRASQVNCIVLVKFNKAIVYIYIQYLPYSGNKYQEGYERTLIEEKVNDQSDQIVDFSLDSFSKNGFSL